MNRLALAIALSACACTPNDATPPAPPATVEVPVVTAEPEATHRDARGYAVVTPGKGIGPIELGMTKTELEALGMRVEEGAYDVRVGPYRVMLDEAGRVDVIEIPIAQLDRGIVIAGKRIDKSERDIERIAMHLSDCGELEPHTGANASSARRGR